LLGSGELCPQGRGTDEIDRSDDVVGQHAERCFTTDLFEISGQETRSNAINDNATDNKNDQIPS